MLSVGPEFMVIIFPSLSSMDKLPAHEMFMSTANPEMCSDVIAGATFNEIIPNVLHIADAAAFETSISP